MATQSRHKFTPTIGTTDTALHGKILKYGRFFSPPGMLHNGFLPHPFTRSTICTLCYFWRNLVCKAVKIEIQILVFESSYINAITNKKSGLSRKL